MRKLAVMTIGQRAVEYRKERGKVFKNIITEIGVGIDFNFVEFDIYEFFFTNDTLYPYWNYFLRHNALHYPNGTKCSRKYGEN